MTNGRAANWAPDVEFSPFRALYRRQINDVPVLLLNQPNAVPAVTPPVSVVSLSMLLFSVTIDLIHDTRHLCMRFRIDGMKAMSRGISEGKQKIKFANARNCRRLCLLSQNKTMI